MRERSGSRQGPARAGCWVCLLAVAVLSAGCAGKAPIQKKPAYLDDPSLHPVYGSSRYLTAVGVSATGPEEAELQARKRVSAQVHSSLEAVDSERLVEVKRAGGPGESLAEYVSLVSAKTRFERAELIKVDTASGFRDKDAWYALATLDRTALAQAAQADYAREAGRFLVLYDQASDAYRRGKPCVFLDKWTQAREAFGRMEREARVLFAAAGGPYAPHAPNEQAFLELFRLRADLKNRMRFYATLDGPASPAGKERIQAIFQRCFERQGLNVSFCSTCHCAGPLAYRFLVKAREHRQWGLLGPVVRLSLSATVVVCETEQPVLDLDLKLDHLRGAHARDEVLALGNLYGQIDEESLYRSFQEAMRAHFCAGE